MTMEQIHPTQEVAKTTPIVPEPEKKVLNPLPPSKDTKMKLVLVGVLVVLAGVGSGWFLSGASAGKSPSSEKAATKQMKEVKVDESSFSDNAQGILREGGLEGEGTHYLDTGAGEEKYVYLLSTVIDLQTFVGKKVEVRGKTLSAEHANWLMDVGKVKLLE